MTLEHLKDSGLLSPALQALRPHLLQLEMAIEEVGAEEVEDLRKQLYQGIMLILKEDFVTGDATIHQVAERINSLAQR